MQALTSPKISPTLFGERALCRLRPAASAHRRQAARARLRAAALLGPPHERPGSAKRCLSAPLECQDIDVPAGFQPGCAQWLPQVRLSYNSTAFGQGVNLLSQVPLNCTTIEPPHPAHSPCLRLCSPPVNISPLIEPTSTRRTRDKVVRPHAPHSAARDAIPKIFLVARARDSNLSAPPPCFSCGLSSGFSRRRLSRAHPTHVLLSTAHCKVHVRVPSARACGRCARRGWCVRLSPTSALTAPMHQQQAQAAHLIATVNGRTYTRYALGLRTGL